ncbi:signal transduction histidine kinase/FixJ family two-component response regulator [Pedobacter cryoconitis]|uniref:hybrid sensor histidine kinase/response regulator n=1 Tax=Pedobacter cryoconitis TaxID=188932 RepID=UPI00161814EA|nr:ATP-binding protein [Pedobacter cryoconitis]MBB6274462.1 signal transduction histidine kinase/FixJ family two-component response regulator [Pedobacter cryoconitis]
MTDVSRKSFLSDAKGKIIIGFVLAFFALFLAWGVSKIAFDEMLNTVDTISTPNAKLRLVNKVSRKVASLDQQQRNLAFNSPGNYGNFFKQSGQLRGMLDSLGGMYSTDSVQLNRIKSIEKLLVQRDKQFINYLKVREGLVNNKSFTQEVQKLNEMVNKGPQQQDSTIVTTEKKTSTVTILPVDESKQRKGFFNRLFSKKKEEQDKSYQVTNEEKIKRDTIALAGETVIAKGLEKSLRSIAKEQQLKSARFLDREATLASANEVLIRQMLDILRKVESEVVTQIEQNGVEAKAVVNTGITRISFIMIGFFLLTVVLLYLILTDITKSNLYRKELEAARDEAEYHGMAKQRFLSNMSHEIRTPLQSIIGYAEIIRHQEHPKLKDIDAIYHSSEHLLQIVNEILDYNRIISGKFTFQQKPFNISELLEEVITIMKPQAEQKKLEMQTEIELHGVDFVMGDAFRLKQILYNLLSNAIKFTQTGQVLLSVFYKRQSDNLHFTFMVKDTGIGLTEEESNRVFNEFEQIDSADKEVINKAGAGLGLTIIKSLVENQDGRIYVKSKPGEGSTFTVYLTFGIAAAPVGEQHIPLISEKVYVKDKVWVVDDDQLILDLCQIIFTKKHIDHLCFNSPADLLVAAWDPKVKYILMDMRMPEISGAELCRRMKAKIPSDVKIYAMTAQVLPEELESVLKQGFDGLIMKPFRENDLLAVFSSTKPADQKEITETDDFSDIALDTAMVEKMTFGDEELLLKILNRFKEDCQHDMVELQQSMSTNDQPLARLIVHRIAGRTAQMGSGQLAAEFRKMEIELAEIQEIDAVHQEKLTLLIKKLSLLMQLVDQKIN